MLQGRITVLNEGLFKESSAAAGVACLLPEMEFLYINLTSTKKKRIFYRKLESFALCNSQALLLADFTENNILLWV